METEQLINSALSVANHYPFHEGPRDGNDVLAFAQINLLAAIAQELKRMNDDRDDDRTWEAHRAEMGL